MERERHDDCTRREYLEPNGDRVVSGKSKAENGIPAFQRRCISHDGSPALLHKHRTVGIPDIDTNEVKKRITRLENEMQFTVPAVCDLCENPDRRIRKPKVGDIVAAWPELGKGRGREQFRKAKTIPTVFQNKA